MRDGTFHLRGLAAGLLVAAGGLATTAYAQPAPAQLCVNPGGTSGCYATIQGAIDAAVAGSAVSVARGIYQGGIVISKSLTLQGARAETTIVDGAGANQAITVQQTGPVTISGFTLENAKTTGLYIQDSSNVTVSGNIVQLNDSNLAPAPLQATCARAVPLKRAGCGEGIHLDGVMSSIVADNLVTLNNGGILLTDETGATHDNLIARNLVQSNGLGSGIALASHPAGSGDRGSLPAYGVYHNRVEHNVSTNNGAAGVGLFAPAPGTATYENTVLRNTLAKNGMPGVTLHSHAPGQNLNGNVIAENSISSNGADPEAKADASGILIFSDLSNGAAPITSITIARNQITAESVGIFVNGGSPSLSLSSNDLGGNDVGVQNAGSGTIDANSNYWGCSDLAGGGCTPVKGAVSFTSPAPAPASGLGPMALSRGSRVSGLLANRTAGATASHELLADGASYPLAATFSNSDDSGLVGITVYGPLGTNVASATAKNGFATLSVPSKKVQTLTVLVFNYLPATQVKYSLNVYWPD